jgi:hypothetical protein
LDFQLAWLHVSPSALGLSPLVLQSMRAIGAISEKPGNQGGSITNSGGSRRILAALIQDIRQRFYIAVALASLR